MYSKRGYLMLGKETTAGTAVYPSIGVEILSESITTNKQPSFSSPIHGGRSKHLHTNRNVNEPPQGTITFECEPNTLGYFLMGVFGDVTTTGPTQTTSYSHLFSHPQVDEDHPTYTVDIAIGEDHVRRYYGCYFHNISFSIQDNVLVGEVQVTALGEFITAKLKTASTATDTALHISQTKGLTTSDTLVIGEGATGEESKAISAITDADHVAVAATAANHSVGDIVCIARQTPSFTQLNKFIFVGSQDVGAVTKIGAAIGTVANRCFEDFNLNFGYEVEPRYCATGLYNEDRYPSVILAKGIEGTIGYTEYFKDYTEMDAFDHTSARASSVTFTGDLSGDTSTRSSLEILMPNMINTKQPLANPGADDIINQEAEYQICYDSTAAYQIKMTLVNQVISY